MRTKTTWLGRGGVVLGCLMLASLSMLGFLQSERFRLESQHGRRATRRIDLDAGDRIRLVRRLSDAPCIQGVSWGYNRDTLWVDEGCRAEFVIERDNDWRSSDWSTGRTTTFTLSSEGGRRATRKIDTRFGVRLIRQLSGSPCIQGRTWGYGSDHVWVDDGCRAQFEVMLSGAEPWRSNRGSARGNPNRIYDGYEDDRWLYVRVASSGNRATRWIDTGRGVTIHQRESGSRPCNFGKTWGFGPDYIWTDGGCRALFRIRKN